MYIIYTIDFNGNKVEYARNSSAISIREIYHSIIKRCLYGFPDIMVVTVEKENIVMMSFTNWRR